MNNNQFQSKSTKAILNIVNSVWSSEKQIFSLNDSNKSVIYSLISFSLRCVGDLGTLLDTGHEIDEFLKENNIPFRQIQTPDDLYKNSRQTIIAFLPENNIPVVIYRKLGTTYLFSPEIYPNKIKLSKNQKFKPYSFEIYSRWPDKIHSPFNVINFALSNNWLPLILVVLTSLILGILNLFVPLLTKMLVDVIIPNSDKNLIFEASIFTLLVALITIISRFFNSLAIVRMETILNLKIETALWSHLLRQPLSFFNKFSAADLVERIGGVSRIRMAFSRGLLTSLITLIFASSNIFLMITQEWRLSIAAIILSIINLFIVLFIVRSKQKLLIPSLESSADLADLSLQAVNGMPQIRVSGSESSIFERWYHKALVFIKLNKRSKFNSDLLEILSLSIQPISQFIIFSLFIILINDPSYTGKENQLVASFIGFQAAYQAFNLQFSLAVNQVSNSIAEILGFWKRLEPIIYATPEETSNKKKIIQTLSGNVEFKDLKLQFPGTDKPIFENINFSIPTGSYTALTGPSGSGKSCLTKCMLRLLEYQKGKIYVDGIDISNFALQPYRKQFGVVMQNSVLPSGSIFDIVKAGRIFTREQVWEAIELSQIFEDVKSMPMELETIISDSGGSISGGQRQRIALARALISKPKILILDEATSALDESTQDSVMAVLDKLDVTRIAIAHRLSTIESADQVVVIKDQRIEEIGKYKDLVLNQNGYFASI